MLDLGWPDHLLAVLWGLAVPFWTAAWTRRGLGETRFDFAAKVTMYWSNSAFLWVAAGSVLWVWIAAGRPLAALGWRRPEAGSGAAAAVLAAAFLAWYAADTLSKLRSPARRRQTRERWQRLTPFMPASAREVAHSLPLVASAAVCEEAVYRGFLISYLATLFGGTHGGLALAIGAPAALFGLSHLYQGWLAVAQIAVLAVAFGLLFVFTGSLWIPMALHFVVDFTGSLLGIWLLRPEREAPRPCA